MRKEFPDLLSFTDDKIIGCVQLVMQKQGFDINSTRTGFHWPPFNTVNHLHLHLISPVENMSIVKRMVFKLNTPWFVSVCINDKLNI